MSSNSFKLDPEQWALVQALEFGAVNAGRIQADLARLELLGLASKVGSNWHLTDYGRLLSASRREI